MCHRAIKTIKKFSLLCLAAVVTSCGFFDKDNTPTPTSLTQYQFAVNPTLSWSTKVGSGSHKHDYLKMSPSIDDLNIYTVSSDGIVTAVNKLNGNIVWKKNIHAFLSTGPGIGDGLVVVANHRGDVFALDKMTGAQRWQTRLSGDFIAKPAVGSGLVLLKAVNGLVTTLSTNNGRIEWAVQQEEPNFLLRGASAPIMTDHSVLIGYANGNLAKFKTIDGELRWLQTIATPEGAFMIQRMVDIDADPVIFQHQIYVATYQGNIASLDWATGRIKWSQRISSYTGMAADDNNVFITDANSYLHAFQATTGTLDWRQNKLAYRRLSGPAIIKNMLVVGDGEGYLHFIAKSNGRLLGRVSLGSAPIYAAPLSDDETIYALNTKGYLAAYRIKG